MEILSLSTVSFGYTHPLKTLFKKGLMPSVTHGLYGRPINRNNVSLEHLQCVSAHGRTVFENLALAHKEANSVRGNRPLAEFLTWEMLENYLRQFNFRVKGLFDGFRYQVQVRKTCERLGIQSSENPLKHLPKKIARSLRNKAKKAIQNPRQLELQFPSSKPQQLEFPFMKDLNITG